MRITTTVRIVLILSIAGLGSCESNPTSPPAKTSANYVSPVLLQRVNPLYPSAMAASQMPGKVTFEFYVEASGEVREVHVIDSTNSEFADEAVKAIEQWKFKPALIDGQPARSHKLRNSVEFAYQ